MKELRAIFGALDALGPDESATLATLVSVQGSSYRREGARMLILGDGRRIGAISSGCLEADLAHRAAKLGPDREMAIVVYNTGDETDALFGTGMGCSGIIRVMLERIQRGREPKYLDFLRSSIEAEGVRAMATVFACEGQCAAGDRMMLADGDVFTQGGWDEELIGRVCEATNKAIASARSASALFQTSRGRAEVCIEVIPPCTRLIIFGANVSARPVAALARQMGWHVTACDRRPAYVSRENFPEADALVAANAAEAKERLRLDARTAAVIMTHNYAEDLALLRMLLPSSAAYVGLLGAHARARQLLAELAREQGIPHKGLDRLYSPVGLDIGSETPDEIALAIVSEIQAVMKGRQGLPLRDRVRAIHDEGGR